MLSVPYQVDSISVLTYSKEISAVISTRENTRLQLSVEQVKCTATKQVTNR